VTVVQEQGAQELRGVERVDHGHAIAPVSSVVA
jgi:hypothetical protein